MGLGREGIEREEERKRGNRKRGREEERREGRKDGEGPAQEAGQVGFDSIGYWYFNPLPLFFSPSFLSRPSSYLFPYYQLSSTKAPFLSTLVHYQLRPYLLFNLNQSMQQPTLLVGVC